MQPITEDIEQFAKLVVEQQYGKDTKDEQTALLAELDKEQATKADIVQAVDYLTGIYSALNQRKANADVARFALLIRALEQNRVLSKDVLKSVKKQLEAINSEENK